MTRPAVTEVSSTKALPAKSGSDWFPVVAFSLIGLLIVHNLMLRFPELGAVIAASNQF